MILAATFSYTDTSKNDVFTESTAPANALNVSQMQGAFGQVHGEVTFDASYPTGGYALSPAKFGLGTVSVVLFDSPLGYVVDYNSSTDKIQVYVMPAAAAAGPLVEETATTDLHTVTAHFVAFGMV